MAYLCRNTPLNTCTYKKPYWTLQIHSASLYLKFVETFHIVIQFKTAVYFTSVYRRYILTRMNLCLVTRQTKTYNEGHRQNKTKTEIRIWTIIKISLIVKSSTFLPCIERPKQFVRKFLLLAILYKDLPRKVLRRVLRLEPSPWRGWCQSPSRKLRTICEKERKRRWWWWWVVTKYFLLS